MFTDGIGIKGDITVIHKPYGENEVTLHYPNLVVHTGKMLIASRLVDTTQLPISHMAVGTNTAVPVSTNTTLGTEVGRVALTQTTIVENVVTYTATFNPGVGTGPLTEAALFNDATTGTMLSRTVFPVINKGPLDELTIIWNITVQ